MSGPAEVRAHEPWNKLCDETCPGWRAARTLAESGHAEGCVLGEHAPDVPCSDVPHDHSYGSACPACVKAGRPVAIGAPLPVVPPMLGDSR